MVEVRNQEQSERLAKIATIGDQQCSVKEHPFYNEVKGFVYMKIAT